MEETSPPATSTPEIKWEDAIGSLSTLNLATVTLGDYVMVMNGEVDAVICGEPHMALQLWFNKKSGKFLARIWNQTIAAGSVKSVAQFIETCSSHLKRRPCIGYHYAKKLESNLQGFAIGQTLLPRKMSPACHKVLDLNTSAGIKSCPECLKFTESEDDIKIEPKVKPLHIGSEKKLYNEPHDGQISTDLAKDSDFIVKKSIKKESSFWGPNKECVTTVESSQLESSQLESIFWDSENSFESGNGRNIDQGDENEEGGRKSYSCEHCHREYATLGRIV